MGWFVLDNLKQEMTNDQSQMLNEVSNFKFQKKFDAEIAIYQQQTTNNKQLILAKPQTFMND
jgi:peptidyl-tRNA hydrolase